MKKDITPSAWAKLRVTVYLCCGIALILCPILARLLDPLSATPIYAALLVSWLLSDYVHIKANLTGDTEKQEQERAAWVAATKPIRTAFEQVCRFWEEPAWEKNAKNPALREMGAIGVDLSRARPRVAGRQSGGRKTGAGGHKKPASSGSDDEGEGEPPAHLPLIWTIHDLAATLAVSAKTLQNQPPHHLPPAIRIPGCRGPRYRLQDVMAWLDGFSAEQRPAKSLPRKVRGRPRIALSLGKGGMA